MSCISKLKFKRVYFKKIRRKSYLNVNHFKFVFRNIIEYISEEKNGGYPVPCSTRLYNHYEFILLQY